MVYRYEAYPLVPEVDSVRTKKEKIKECNGPESLKGPVDVTGPLFLTGSFCFAALVTSLLRSTLHLIR